MFCVLLSGQYHPAAGVVTLLHGKIVKDRELLIASCSQEISAKIVLHLTAYMHNAGLSCESVQRFQAAAKNIIKLL